MKVFILKEEDLYSKSDMAEHDCSCSNDWNVVGVFSSKELANAYIAKVEKVNAKYSYASKRYFDIEEMELDA